MVKWKLGIILVEISIFILVGGLLCTMTFAADEPLSMELAYSCINLSHPEKSIALIIPIPRELSIACHWKPWQELRVRAFVERKSGRKEYLVDSQGKNRWDVRLNSYGQGELVIMPAAASYTGRVQISINGKVVNLGRNALSFSLQRTLEKRGDYRFGDGTTIAVHYTDEILEENATDEYFAKEVLDDAVSAYQTITQFEGFNTAGFTFASPDKQYAYDPTRTIDVYLGTPGDSEDTTNHGFNARAFKEAPCFDTVKLSGNALHAVILLPANYRQFIKNWERLNPSPLGTRNVEVDLRGTLIHEMLHVVLFYYNHNLNKAALGTGGADAAGTPRGLAKPEKVDWYVEGLARYFETFAGARHDFYSPGFKQMLPDKIRFSRGGSNYFMRYPDQPFTDLRYESALFWRFMDFKYGMPTIERLSRFLRRSGPEGFQEALKKVTGKPFERLLEEFALALLSKDFGLKDDAVYLKEVAKTHLSYHDHAFYLKDGFGAEKPLGRVCQTDWIGEWNDRRAKFEEASVAGDNTPESDISGWATDFYQIDLRTGGDALPELAVTYTKGIGRPLTAIALVASRGGSLIKRQIGEITPSSTARINLSREMDKEHLRPQDIEKVYLLITNTDPTVKAQYEISVTS